MLAAARIKNDYSASEIARKLGTTEEKIRAFEEGKYEQFSHDVFTEGLLRKYAEAVGLDKKAITERYRQERQNSVRPKPRRRQIAAAPIVTGRLSVLILAGAAFLLVIGYVVSQVFTLTGDPALNIIFPAENQIIYSREVEVVGTTDPGSEIYVDNRLVEVSDDGNFRVEVILSPGVHGITIEARNRLGRSTRLTRTIIVDTSTGE